MGVALPWQTMTDLTPGVRGRIWNDGLSRTNANQVRYSFNFSATIVSQTGYWNYAWYVDMQVGDNIQDGSLIKPLVTGYNKKIYGIEYYKQKPNIEGTINVGGKDKQITVRATFHDSAGNWGWAVYWGVAIPQASSLGKIAGSVSGIDVNKATITGKTNSRGNYATITKWRLEYGINNYTEHSNTINGDSLSRSWNLTGLRADTTYKYRLTSWNSAGYSVQTTGTFRTLEDYIGVRVLSGQSNKDLTGRVVFPDGRVKKIRKIIKVDPL